jgi:type IV pilus assembly PilO-like protein
MIERLNGRTSVAIAVVGLLLVVLVGWLGFVSPQRSKAADLAAEISDTETQLAVTEALVQGPLLRRSTAELVTLRTAIPDQVRMSQILRQLSKASSEARVRVLGITPQPVTKVGVADVVAMNVTVEGRYFGIRQFLRLLRSRAYIKSDKVHASGRLFAVDSIQFDGGSTESGNLINATLTVTAFAFSRPVAVPSTSPDGSVSGIATAEPGSEASTR